MNERDAGLIDEPLQPAPPALYQPARIEPDEAIQHSLFGEILDWMLAPLLLLWPMSIAITYLVAKAIANQPFDHALEERLTALAQQVRQHDGTPLARIDDSDALYVQVIGPQGELVDGERELPAPMDEDKYRRGRIHFRNDNLHGTPLRIAFTYIGQGAARASDSDEQRASLLQVGETLDQRDLLANAIIKGVILPQFIILPIVLALVWFALARGLSPLAELQSRIRARRPDDLSPIDSGQVPEEITPLVGSLNDMLERLSQSIDMQKRFIADAAHQMKTPLAGMRMQSELALRLQDGDEIHRSLLQLARSSESATRLVNQLLALARAENQPHASAAFVRLDLGELARAVVQDWVPASFAQRIDLGYEGPASPVPIDANPVMLRELLSNLIDNALRYTPAGGAVTVRVRAEPGVGLLEVEDNGPGIAAAEKERVFERFYRILGSNVDGSGLGLAIVREIAQQHGAEIDLFANPRSNNPKFPGCLFRLSFVLPDPPENVHD